MANHVMKPGNLFQKGKSGNPGGRKKTPEDVKRLLRENCYAAIEADTDWTANFAVSSEETQTAVDLTADASVQATLTTLPGEAVRTLEIVGGA